MKKSTSIMIGIGIGIAAAVGTIFCVKKFKNVLDIDDYDYYDDEDDYFFEDLDYENSNTESSCDTFDDVLPAPDMEAMSSDLDKLSYADIFGTEAEDIES